MGNHLNIMGEEKNLNNSGILVDNCLFIIDVDLAVRLNSRNAALLHSYIAYNPLKDVFGWVEYDEDDICRRTTLTKGELNKARKILMKENLLQERYIRESRRHYYRATDDSDILMTSHN